MARVVGRLVSFMRCQNQEEKEVARSRMLFGVQAINTGLLPLLVNAPLSLWTTFGAQRTFDDFSVDWYTDVGAQILIVMLLNVLTPHIYWVAAWLWTVYLRRKNAASAKSQHDLNARFLGPRFDISVRYSDIMLCLWGA
jgi:hypothetical protein